MKQVSLNIRRDEQDSQAPGALMAALIKHTKISNYNNVTWLELRG